MACLAILSIQELSVQGYGVRTRCHQFYVFDHVPRGFELVCLRVSAGKDDHTDSELHSADL
jgi:hypothetical protein